MTLVLPGFVEITRPGPQLLLVALAMMVANALAVIGPLYVFWSAARALCSIEEGRPASADCCLRAWFQFLFLPFRIFTVQKRLHRVLGQSPS